MIDFHVGTVNNAGSADFLKKVYKAPKEHPVKVSAFLANI